MPNQIRYCTDNCGPGRKYRDKCNWYHGVDIDHIGLGEFDRNQDVHADLYCTAASGHRMCTLRVERVNDYGEEI